MNAKINNYFRFHKRIAQKNDKLIHFCIDAWSPYAEALPRPPLSKNCN